MSDTEKELVNDPTLSANQSPIKKDINFKSRFAIHWPVWAMFATLLITDIALLFVQNSIAAIFLFVAGVTVAQGLIDFYRHIEYKPVWSLLLRLLALACAALILWQRGWQ